MTRNLAAGLLMCKLTRGDLNYFLVHPGGPFFRNKDAGFWTIPKGIPEGGENLIETAVREFFEETGIKPQPPFHDIGTVKQRGGKVIHAWTFIGDWSPETGIQCNTFPLEWPPRSGKKVDFPEVDKAAWMNYAGAKSSIIPAQVPFLEKARTVFSF